MTRAFLSYVGGEDRLRAAYHAAERAGCLPVVFGPVRIVPWAALDNAARSLRAILAAEDPSRSWTVEVRP